MSFIFDNKKNVTNFKNKSPSQQKRDIQRQQEFQKTRSEKLTEAFEECNKKTDVTKIEKTYDEDLDCEVKATETTEYKLMIEAHETCRNYDIIEAIEVNFDGTLNDKRVEKNDASRDILVQKIEEKTNDDLLKYSVVINNNETAKDVIESWRETHKFDGLS